MLSAHLRSKTGSRIGRQEFLGTAIVLPTFIAKRRSPKPCAMASWFYSWWKGFAPWDSSSKDIKTMDDLFLHTLQDVYYAENQIVKALPKMIDKTTNRELAAGLREHLRETEGQVTRLDQVFKKLGQTPKGVDCPAIDGLIKEADEVAGEVDDKKVLDAAIIGSARAVEHYEISRYGTLIAWARELGHGNVVTLLKANLKQEKAADKKLNSLAEGGVNRRATGRMVSKTPARRAAASSSSVKRKTGTAKRRTMNRKKNPSR